MHSTIISAAIAVGSSPMTDTASEATWKSIAVLVARLVFAAVFALGAVFKFLGIEATAGYIAAAGFPFPLFLAWVAAIFEVILILGFLTGAFFTEVCLLAALYVVFLAFAFHMSGWGQDELGGLKFGAFVSHFPYAAGLLFGAASGPGKWAMKKTLIG